MNHYFGVAMKTSKFVFVGNYLCLDFLNTEVVEKGKSIDLLGNFSDLAEWLFEAEVVDARGERAITRKWNDHAVSASALEQAREFRAVLRRIIGNIVQAKPVGKSSIEEINRILRKQNEYSYLRRENGEYKMRSQLLFDQPVHLLSPIAKSAADLLVNANFSLIKKCENPNCILYYYDTSKNQKRRWCSMKICGNRIKAATHYKRKKQQVC
jgi:predicted RNA-binding Zn ribbon-like protein